MAEISDETRNARNLRMNALKPLFAKADEVGLYRAELARRLGMTRTRLWRYEHGWDRVPPDFIKRACRLLHVRQSIVQFAAPKDLYIQQPRTKPALRTKGRQTDESSRNGDGNGSGHGGFTRGPQQPRRIRRAERTQAPHYPASL